jgi:hypothetical protein
VRQIQSTHEAGGRRQVKPWIGIPSTALLVLLIASPQLVLSAEDSYDCIQSGHTNIGWSERARNYTAEAIPKGVAKPGIVKLSGITTDRPLLTGQGVVPLIRLAGDGTTTWFAEQASAGTIIVWTFFRQQKDSGPQSAVLISTKSYDFLGPVSFTDLYVCKSNMPTGR